MSEVSSVTFPVAISGENENLGRQSGGQRVTSVMLNGRNFAAWSRSMRLFLGSRGVIDWIVAGKIKKLAETDADFGSCLGWFYNSMEPDVYDLFVFYEIVDSLWAALTEMYSTTHNEVRIYELFREPSQATQGSMSVTTYFGYLKKRWDELNVYHSLTNITGMTSEVALEIQKREDKQRIYQFLIGLQPEYEAIRTQILTTSPLPSLGETYAMIEKHERRVQVSSKITETTPVEQVAFAANSKSFGSTAGNTRTGGTGGGALTNGFRRSKLFCDYCKKPGHTKDKCYQLHPELRPKPEGNMMRTAAVSEILPGSGGAPATEDINSRIEQVTSKMDQMLQMFRGEHSGPTAMTATADTPTALHARAVNPKGSWILDSGANDHITGPSFEADFWQGI